MHNNYRKKTRRNEGKEGLNFNEDSLRTITHGIREVVIYR